MIVLSLFYSKVQDELLLVQPTITFTFRIWNSR